MKQKLAFYYWGDALFRSILLWSCAVLLGGAIPPLGVVRPQILLLLVPLTYGCGRLRSRLPGFLYTVGCLMVSAALIFFYLLPVSELGLVIASLFAGNLPQTVSEKRAYMGVSFALYLAGFFSNSAVIRILASALLVISILLDRYACYQSEIQGAVDLGQSTNHFFAEPLVAISRRQWRIISGGIAAVGLCFLGVLLLLQPFGHFAGISLESVPPAQQQLGATAGQQEELQRSALFDELDKQGKESPLAYLWQFLDQLLRVVVPVLICLILAALLFFAVRESWRAIRPKEQAVDWSDEELADLVVGNAAQVQKPQGSFWDRSFAKRVRQLFKRQVKKAQLRPVLKDTAASLSKELPLSELQKSQLQALYEKARYSQHEISAEEWQRLKQELK